MEIYKIIHPTTGRSVEVSKKAFEEFAAMSKIQQTVQWQNYEAMTPVKVQEPVKQDSVAATLAQRGSRYGDFTDHARICQALKEVMLDTTGPSSVPIPRGWRYLSDVQKQALEVIADKIARILSGDPNYDDNWHDIQGYAKLVEDRLPKEKKES